jgi:hypothetical protein
MKNVCNFVCEASKAIVVGVILGAFVLLSGCAGKQRLTYEHQRSAVSYENEVLEAEWEFDLCYSKACVPFRTQINIEEGTVTFCQSVMGLEGCFTQPLEPQE